MKKLSLLLAVLLVPLFLGAKDTVVYHTSDTHGFFYPRNGQGGFAALAAVIKKGPKEYLLIDSGDFANGTVETKNSKGIKGVQMLNAMHYDASTVGNHEFDFSENAVAPMIAASEFPWLAANFFYADTLKRPEGVLPYKIFTRNGVKIAVIGLANRFPTQKTTKYTYTKPFDALEQALKEVEPQHPDVVLVIVHDSIEDDKHGTVSYVGEIGPKFGGRVHVVFGGHAHKTFENVYKNGVLFVESGCYLQKVSKVTITTDDKTGKFVSAKSEEIPLIVSKTGEDVLIKDYADSLREPGVDVVLGRAAETFPKRSPVKDHRDNALDNWVADLTKAYADVDVAIANTGGTRVDMEKGPITKRDLIDIHPFDNAIVKMTVDGRFLKRMILSGLTPWSRFAYSGATVTYKLNKKGEVKNLDVRINGKKIQNRKLYTIATNSFIANGGSEGRIFKEIPADKKEPVGTTTIRDLIAEALSKGAAVPPATGRIIEK